jgi:hypothetical protein
LTRPLIKNSQHAVFPKNLAAKMRPVFGKTNLVQKLIQVQAALDRAVAVAAVVAVLVTPNPIRIIGANGIESARTKKRRNGTRKQLKYSMATVR